MRYRFTKNEISICDKYGCLTLSIMLDGNYIHHSYMGYTKQEAIRKFQQEFGDYPSNYVPAGVLSLNNFGGIAIMKFENGIDTYAYVCDNYGDGYKKLTKNKIYYNIKGNPYFVRYGKRYYLDQFMKV